MATHSAARAARGRAKRQVSSPVRTTLLPSGAAVPVLGQGTWHMAEEPRRRDQEIAALRFGIDLALTLIDTAEMYADGGAEELVGEAIAGRRHEVFLVSKVLPSHATRRGTIAACERSLRRLATDRLDLYLLHWREKVPLEETVEAFHSLSRAGKIRYWGVSNFDLSDMQELVEVPGGDAVQTNQVLYNLTRRGIEYDLLPWCRQRALPIMAYSPIEQGRLLGHSTLQLIADQHDATPAQIALAWVLRQEGVIAIPRASKPEHVEENRAALGIRLTQNDLELLDRAFPPPTKPVPLEMLSLFVSTALFMCTGKQAMRRMHFLASYMLNRFPCCFACYNPRISRSYAGYRTDCGGNCAGGGFSGRRAPLCARDADTVSDRTRSRNREPLAAFRPPHFADVRG